MLYTNENEIWSQQQYSSSKCTFLVKPRFRILLRCEIDFSIKACVHGLFLKMYYFCILNLKMGISSWFWRRHRRLHLTYKEQTEMPNEFSCNRFLMWNLGLIPFKPCIYRNKTFFFPFLFKIKINRSPAMLNFSFSNKEKNLYFILQ
jgi:hypothetical protein